MTTGAIQATSHDDGDNFNPERNARVAIDTTSGIREISSNYSIAAGRKHLPVSFNRMARGVHLLSSLRYSLPKNIYCRFIITSMTRGINA